MAEVKLLGFWASPFSCRVIWALKLKGIAYEYVEEDFPNKSPLLLQNNPVHKKVPVLLHGGKSICESMIILEYIDEVWPQNPLLPDDPCERAVARFWIKFIEDKVLSIWTALMLSSTDEEQEKAVKDSMEILKTIEEQALGEKKFFSGDSIGIVDLAYGGIPHWFGVLEVVVGVKFFEPRKFPRLHAWFKNLMEEPIIKENVPDRDKLLVLYKARRERLLASAQSK